MPLVCATRALKVRRYLEQAMPASLPESSRKTLADLSPRVLSRLHTTEDLSRHVPDPDLAAWLTANPVPAPVVAAGHPLFHGTLVFVQLTFNRPNQRRSPRTRPTSRPRSATPRTPSCRSSSTPPSTVRATSRSHPRC